MTAMTISDTERRDVARRLRELPDEMEQETGSVCGVCMGKSARRIREALGVVA